MLYKEYIDGLTPADREKLIALQTLSKVRFAADNPGERMCDPVVIEVGKVVAFDGRL